MLPTIGITCDVAEPEAGKVRAVSALTYARAIARAGGVPVLLPPLPELVEHFLERLDGLMMTGGDDVDVRQFGKPLHAAASVMHPHRQAFELALLRAIDQRPALPVLGVCLGMQLMGLHAGGDLNQHLPDTLASADRHRRDFHHAIVPDPSRSADCDRFGLVPGTAASNHHQALDSAGRLSVLARSDDGVIEAIADLGRQYYLGVEWHPERTTNESLGLALIRRFVGCCRPGSG